MTGGVEGRRRTPAGKSPLPGNRPPSAPGIYVLVLSATDSRRVPVGRLGILELHPGTYLYVGSACGPGGLRARISHHLGSRARPRWHLDYLRVAVRPVEIWYACEGRSREHDWAAVLAGLRGCGVPLRGFGASDCRCQTHLFFFRRKPGRDRFRRELRTRWPDHAPLQRLILESAADEPRN